MNRFRNRWRSTDITSNPSSVPITNDGPVDTVPDRNSGGPPNQRLTGRQSSQPNSQSQSRENPSQPQSGQQRAGVLQYSPYSTPGPFQTRMFVSENFMLGAGAVIIQPSSGKVVIVQDGDHWFLPKGRKDLGESIEHAALREAYEESGYRCEFLPLYHWTNAPVESRRVHGQKHTEPLYVVMTSYLGRRNRPPGEYLTFWYVCQIGPEAVRELGTGMPDEAGYVSHLVTHEVADQLLNDVERMILAAALNEWLRSMEVDEQICAMEAQKVEEPIVNKDGERK